MEEMKLVEWFDSYESWKGGWTIYPPNYEFSMECAGRKWIECICSAAGVTHVNDWSPPDLSVFCNLGSNSYIYVFIYTSSTDNQ